MYTYIYIYIYAHTYPGAEHLLLLVDFYQIISLLVISWRLPIGLLVLSTGS